MGSWQSYTRRESGRCWKGTWPKTYPYPFLSNIRQPYWSMARMNFVLAFTLRRSIANSKKFYEQRFFSFLSLTIFIILPITSSQLLSTILFLHPFKFFLSQKKKKHEKETFPLAKKERIVKIKKKKEKYERERVVTRGPRQRTGCNSQIYYFSPLVSGAYFMPKRQTGAQAERGEDERRGNEYLSCFVAFLRPRDILVDR